MIKRLCRKLGMPRWPFRQIDSINKAMEDLHDQLEGARTEADRTRCVLQGSLSTKWSCFGPCFQLTESYEVQVQAKHPWNHLCGRSARFIQNQNIMKWNRWLVPNRLYSNSAQQKPVEVTIVSFSSSSSFSTVLAGFSDSFCSPRSTSGASAQRSRV